MKTTQLIMLALSFVLGLGVMALLRTDKESQKATSSNQSSSEIENKDKKTGSNSSTSNLISNVPSKPKNTPFKINEDPEDEEPEGPEE
ncbi:MAG: hypothetical protein VX577_02570, partial [Verrucomicrobiota bacterium]|nr:hypothetical protein [Verrucomicrobiota bacterium]